MNEDSFFGPLCLLLLLWWTQIQGLNRNWRVTPPLEHWISSSPAVCFLPSMSGSDPSSHPGTRAVPLSLVSAASPASTLPRQGREVERGAWEGWGGTERERGNQPTDKTGGPVTNPNPQSLTGQSLLSAERIPDCGHIEDIKQQTSTCPLRYQGLNRRPLYR